MPGKNQVLVTLYTFHILDLHVIVLRYDILYILDSNRFGFFIFGDYVFEDLLYIIDVDIAPGERGKSVYADKSPLELPYVVFYISCYKEQDVIRYIKMLPFRL